MTYAVVETTAITSPADLTIRQSGVAACILEALDDEEASAALGLCHFTVAAIVRRLQVRTGTKNRVGLALALRDLCDER